MNHAAVALTANTSTVAVMFTPLPALARRATRAVVRYAPFPVSAEVTVS